MATVTVFGGSGFLGRRIVETLAARGDTVRLVTRHPEQGPASEAAARLGPGTVQPVEADVMDAASVAAAVAGAYAVVNAVGLYAERGEATFAAVHVDGARRVAAAAKEAGASRLVHLSGIGADERSPSPYVRSRGRGEVVVRDAFAAATLFRPSAMFAAEGGLLTTLVGLVRRSPVVPLFGRGETRLQPVFAGDVAAAVGAAVDADWAAGSVLELGGPEVLTYRMLLERAMAATGRRRLLLPVPFAAWTALAAAGQLLPTPPLTEGQVALMRADNVASTALPGLEALGITPTPLDPVLREVAGR
jgi:uncharacterized protein YbjT (DUF2867 family)